MPSGGCKNKRIRVVKTLKLAKCCCDVRDVSILRLTCRAADELNFALGNLLANIHAEGDANQVSVLEFNAGTLVAVVEQNVISSGLKVSGDPQSGRKDGFIRDV